MVEVETTGWLLKKRSDAAISFAKISTPLLSAPINHLNQDLSDLIDCHRLSSRFPHFQLAALEARKEERMKGLKKRLCRSLSKHDRKRVTDAVGKLGSGGKRR